MFWRFGGYANVSTIDTILEKDNFQLEELLDETDLIQELKQHNAKLIEYLREPKVLEKLLQYVVAPKLEPVASQDDDDETEDEDEIKGKGLSLSFNSSTSTCDDAEKKRNRYAFVAAEILSADVWSLYEALLESRDLLVNFWQFLTRPSPLDPLQASYFTKVNESLFDKKTAEMIDLLKSMDGAVANLLRHVDCPMIMDLLLKIISLERNEAGQGIVEWLYSQDLMPTLISFLGPEHPWSTQTSAADFIKAIITVSANASQNEQACIGPNELTRQLVSRPCVEQLIKYMLGGGNPLTCGVGIVIEVIRKNNSDYDPEGVDIHAPPTSKDPIYLGTLLRLFAEHIPDFMNLIMTAPAQEHRLNSTFGDRIEPLGFDRFKTCELMAELLHCSNMVLLNEPGSEEFIAARDAERHRLRAEGKLMPTPGAAGPMRRENLSLQASQLSAADENRKLEVTNSSVEDDGFEEVSHATEEEITHGVLELPDAPLPTGSSLLDKDDDDFVDEPLSSPRLKYSEPVRSDDQLPFEDPDLVVPPLSPKKQTEQDSSSGKTPGPSGTKEEEKERPTTMVEPSPAKPVEEKPPPKTEEIAKEDTPSQPSETAAETTAASQTASEGDSILEQSRDTIDESVNTSIIIANITEAPNPVETTPPPAKPVVGDFLKMQLVKYNVVPTILSFFFKYPWNNFLHNVVYDIVQQVFNGPMDRGYNPTLAISLFEQADITTQIINGQKASEKSEAEIKTRQGYMGHLTLIAEEVVKFTERHPPELLSETVLNKVMAPEWVQYVEGPLAETRERDNAILGGVRPEAVMARGSASLMGFAGLSSIGLSASASNALAEAGLNGGLDSGEGSGSLGAFSISAGTLMSGFGSSSDEDDDEEQETEEDVNNEVGGTSPSFGDCGSPLGPSGTGAYFRSFSQARSLTALDEAVRNGNGFGAIGDGRPHVHASWSYAEAPHSAEGDDVMDLDEAVPALEDFQGDGTVQSDASAAADDLGFDFVEPWDASRLCS